ncbi:MAG: hypothetical protein JO206_04800 [Solirubrobacterales bacterium]|nr:hypothetical protein [Solirubrobacterales bacterium]MBV9837156.1 hypothetical protein [Solirubrobacterales bacterium]
MNALSTLWAALCTTLAASIRRSAGQTMPEYALLLGVIALVVLAVGVLLGSSISAIFGATASHV